jgi:hypothetical protein
MAPGWAFVANLPDFNGNPGESWDMYEADIQLAYDGAGQAPDKDEVKRAHLLRGLKGEAQNFLKLNPHLRTASYEEVRAILRKRFTKPAWKKMAELPYLKQEHGETVKGYAERLKSAARSLSPKNQFTPLLPVTKKEEAAIKADDQIEKLTDEQMSERTKAYHELLDMMVFHHFLEGLREEIGNPVRNALPRTMEEAIAIAERYEDQMLMQDGFRRLNLTVADHTAVDPTVRRAEAQLKALNNNEEPAGSAKPAFADFRCYHCNQKGHYARHCAKRDEDYAQKRIQRGRRFMGNNDPSMRRNVPDMPRQAATQQRTNGQHHGKFAPRPQRSDRRPGGSRDNRRQRSPYEERDKNRRSEQQEGPDENGRSTWLQNRKPKNGSRPPRRGGMQKIPQAIRYHN